MQCLLVEYMGAALMVFSLHIVFDLNVTFSHQCAEYNIYTFD